MLGCHVKNDLHTLECTLFILTSFLVLLFHHFCFLNYKYEQPDPLMGCISRKRNKKFATNCWITSLSLSLSLQSNYLVLKKKKAGTCLIFRSRKELIFSLCFGVELKRATIVLQRSKEKFSVNIATIWK